MFVGDVIAVPGMTSLIKVAAAAGCKTADGRAMVQSVQELIADFVTGISEN
jgi:shikimate dehydrogenase